MGLVRFEPSDDAVTMRIDRPEKANALDGDLREALEDGLDRAARHAVPLVVASATPGIFMGGADVAELRDRTLDDSLLRKNLRLFERIEAHPYPTIAVVDGPALGGGCEFALAFDFRIASTRSLWGQPEVRLGLIPSGGALWRLPRLVGWAVTTDLVLTGRRLPADEAVRLGLAQRLAEPDELDGALRALLDDLAASTMSAKRLAKEIMRASWPQTGAIEAFGQALALTQSDTRERLDAFVRRSRDGDRKRDG